MNNLESLLTDREAQIEAMNSLQDHHIISDNCVWLCDIAEADEKAAFDHLTKNHHAKPE